MLHRTHDIELNKLYKTFKRILRTHKMQCKKYCVRKGWGGVGISNFKNSYIWGGRG